MTEPLTDEEFEELKKNWESIPGDFTDWKITRLIATVELQKSDKALGSALVRKIQEIKEQNAKLKEDYYAPSVTIDELRKENVKLKTELDAALKRIEEME